jgi:cytochrome c2
MLALTIGIVVVIAIVIALQQLSAPPPAPTPTQTTTPTQATTPTTQTTPSTGTTPTPTTTPTQTTTPTPTTTPTQTTTPTTQTTPSTGTTPSAGIKYDPQLAEKGKQYFSEIGCTACHAIKSLGISGGAVGPELSKALLGNPGAGGSVIGRFFKEKGLENPAADPEKAAELLKEFLTDPPQYSTTMKRRVQAYKATYSDWATEHVPALVELLKEAAAKASG